VSLQLASAGVVFAVDRSAPQILLWIKLEEEDGFSGRGWVEGASWNRLPGDVSRITSKVHFDVHPRSKSRRKVDAILGMTLCPMISLSTTPPERQDLQ